MEYNIRKFEIEDIKKLQPIFEEGDRFHYDLEPERYNSPKTITRNEEFFKDYYTNKEKALFVAERKDNFEIVGHINGQICNTAGHPVFRDMKYGFVSNIVVKSNYHRKGIATLLLQKMQEWFLENNTEEIQLGVVAQNIAAYRLYEKLGYKTNIYRMIKSLKDF